MSEKKELIMFSRWLIGYVMDLHEHHGKMFSIVKNAKEIEEIKDLVIEHNMRFPVLQGFSNQMNFKKVGFTKDEEKELDQDAMHRAFKAIQESFNNE